MVVAAAVVEASTPVGSVGMAAALEPQLDAAAAKAAAAAVVYSR